MPRAHPLRFTPIRQALARLLRTARTLAANLRARPESAPPKPIHPGYTIARTTEWLAALARTLAGDTTWLIVPTYIFPPFPGRYPSLTAKLREEIGLLPVPPPTEAQKAAARRRYIRKVFATLPTATIAARLARRLGLTKTDAAWPTALLAIAETPAAHAKSSSLMGRVGVGAATAPPPPGAPHLQPPSTTAHRRFGLPPPRWRMA